VNVCQGVRLHLLREKHFRHLLQSDEWTILLFSVAAHVDSLFFDFWSFHGSTNGSDRWL
jgi:hypothetical protein